MVKNINNEQANQANAAILTYILGYIAWMAPIKKQDLIKLMIPKCTRWRLEVLAKSLKNADLLIETPNYWLPDIYKNTREPNAKEIFLQAQSVVFPEILKMLDE